MMLTIITNKFKQLTTFKRTFSKTFRGDRFKASFLFLRKKE